jgi:hypothetical protein
MQSQNEDEDPAEFVPGYHYHSGGKLPRIVALPLLPFALLVAWTVLYGRFLLRPLFYLLVWALWLPRGITVLFVSTDGYSERFDSKIFPTIRGSSEVLTWPKFGPRQWRRTVAVAVYRHFVVCLPPMALVFRPFRCVKRFDFSSHLRDSRLGNPGALEALDQVEREFLDYVRKSE